MGQEILNPIDVAGWQENHDWISTGTLPMRWDFSDYLLSGTGLRIKNNLEIMQLVLLELKKLILLKLLKKLINTCFVIII